MVKILKDHGADVNKVDALGNYAVIFALEWQDQSLIEDLLPTDIPTGPRIWRIYHEFSRFKTKISDPIKRFISQAVKSG